jgi:hypothetical protein
MKILSTKHMVRGLTIASVTAALIGVSLAGATGKAQAGENALQPDPSSPVIETAQAKSKDDKIVELIKLSGAENVMDQVLPPMIENLRQSLTQRFPNIKPEHIAIITDAMEQEFLDTRKVFFSAMTAEYDKIFTEDQIDDLIAFYQSPTGKMMVEKAPLVAQAGMKVGRQWGMLAGQRAVQKAKQKLHDLGYQS